MPPLTREATERYNGTGMNRSLPVILSEGKGAYGNCMGDSRIARKKTT